MIILLHGKLDTWDLCEVGIMRNGGSGKCILGYVDIRKNATYVK